MTAITTNHFDALTYVKKSKELGVPEQVAEYQARQIEQSIEIAVNTIRIEAENKDLATKDDIALVRSELRESELRLQKEIAQASNRTILWVSGLLGTFGVFFLSILAKGFHWI